MFIFTVLVPLAVAANVRNIRLQSHQIFHSNMRKRNVLSVSYLLQLLLFLSFHFSLCFLASAVDQSYFERGASSSVEDNQGLILASPDNCFSFGFYKTGINAYGLATWFTNSREKTVVWMANRDRPVNGHGSKVSLEKNGAMVLTDVDGTLVWQSNTTSIDVAKAELLDTGNLVFRNSKSEIVWQSFDYPTDTLLPSQTLTKSKRLVSSLRKGSYGSGYFNLYFDSSNVLSLVYDGPEISSVYWPNPGFDVYRNGRTNYNSSRIAVLDQMGTFRSTDRLEFNVTDMGAGRMRRMTLDCDGNFRVYSLINSTGLWETTWQAIAKSCDVHGLCGRNGICIYSPEAKCACPPGYVVNDPTDWNQGCKATFNLSHIQPAKFLEISTADYYGFDLNFSKSITFEACKSICLGSSGCLAFTYKNTGDDSGLCYAKSALFNGYKSPDFDGSLFLKIPQSLPTSSEPMILQGSRAICSSQGNEIEIVMGSSSMLDTAGSRVRWVYLFSFVSAIGAVEFVFFALGWFFLFRKSGVPALAELGYHMIAIQFRRFSYHELKKATDHFKEEVGRGASGVVYKGVLADGRDVAVKRLGDVLQGDDEFWAEMSIIGKINHFNLVRTWGYCSEKQRKLLVYEYVQNSSLDKHLFGPTFLGWKQRYEVALGIAKGLAYLHHECLEWVIHCDIKPENILLDSDLQPKIADFGLAKLSQRREGGGGGGGGSELSKIRGTKGYLAPEWALNQPITAKVDVYSYGVVILEIVRGVRLSNWAMDEGNIEQEADRTKLVRTIRQNGEEFWMENIVDAKLEGNFDRKQVVALIQVGLSCIEEDRSKRPTMASVVQTLIESDYEDPTEGTSTNSIVS